jgi:hypothetical protein
VTSSSPMLLAHWWIAWSSAQRGFRVPWRVQHVKCPVPVGGTMQIAGRNIVGRFALAAGRGGRSSVCDECSGGERWIRISTAYT